MISRRPKRCLFEGGRVVPLERLHVVALNLPSYWRAGSREKPCTHRQHHHEPGREGGRSSVVCCHSSSASCSRRPSVCLAVEARDTAASLGPVDPYADVLPGALDRARRAAEDLSAYQMEVTLDPEASTIEGDLELSWRNPATQPLDDVWFRLFPNADYYGPGDLAVADVTVDGAAVTPEMSLGDTALRVPLPHPVQPGARAEIAMTFTATIPADSSGSYGIYTHETQNGTWVLADWYPILSVWEEGSGWALPPVTSFGDPTYAPSAFYEVTLSAPEDLAVMATGVVAGETEADGIATRRFAAGPARDFVIVADDDETPLRQSVDGTQVTLWTAPNIDAAIATRTLDLATEALHFYNERFGQLPAREIDLVQTNPRGALGIAWTGLVFLDGPGLLATYGEHDPEGSGDDRRARGLAPLVGRDGRG